jgi:murein tripeptide amidase MpaA
VTVTVTPVGYARIPTYAELTELVHAWAAEAPGLVTVDSIGQSWQGRDIWLLTVTDRATGDPSTKPALLVEATIHSAELTAGMSALHLTHRLLTGHGSDEQVSRLLERCTVYVIPRLSADGAEVVLAEGRYVRSSVRPHPSAERAPGLHELDVDGDRRVLFMRQPDPDGPWKRSTVEPRLLVRRDPDEYGGDYFRLFVEGEVVGYDGLSVPIAPVYEGLDLAANFHSDWQDMPRRSTTAGGYGGSEPEIAALKRAVEDRPNITAYVSCHTFGAVHLHPPLNDGDVVPTADAEVFAELGAMASARTGYPAMSYNDLKHVPYRVKGGQLAWFYHERGILSWITELWNPLRAAGIEHFHPAKWLVDHPESDDHALIRWSDDELDGQGYVDWYAFDHPQLGPVELGGWDLVHYWYNPPLNRIEAEVAPHTDWLVALGLTLPRLAVRATTVTQVGPGVHRVRVAVANTGWLPTSGTRKAADRAQCGPVVVEAVVTGDADIVSGAGPTELSQLAGRHDARTTTTWWGHDPGTPDVAVHEVLVQVRGMAELTVTARHPRAGVTATTVALSADPG